MGKRGNSEGSIRKREDGRWEARLVLSNGERKSLYGKTRQEAARRLAEATRDRELGLTATSNRQTVEQYLTVWYETIKKHDVRPSTHLRYGYDIRLHLIPGLGRHQLSKLRAQDVQALYTSKLDQGYASSSVQHIHVALHDALNDAVRLGLIVRNVADMVKPPRIIKHEMAILSEEQARTLLATVAGDRLEALIVLALATGMREGELIALRWGDVDLDDASLQVRRTLQCTAEGYRWEDAKTTHSRRRIALPATVVEALRRHRLHQLEERLLVGEAWEDLDLVFSNQIGRRLSQFMFKAFPRAWFGRLLKRAELPKIRFHDLRHTAATLLLARGINPKVVSEMLGHSSVSVTLNLYGHVTPHMQREAAATMDAVLRQ